MSGPKLSQAEIERRQRARLENQREEYLRGAAGLQQQKDQICQWLAGEAFQKLRGESTAVADAVRRELEEGMSRLEEIPVPDMQTLDSYPGTLAQAEQKNRERFSGLERIIQREEQRLAAAGQRQSGRKWEERLSRLIQYAEVDRPTASGVIGFDFDGEIQELRGQLFWLARNLKEGCIPGQKRMRALSEKGSRELEAYASDPNLHSRREQAKLLVEKLLNEWQEELRRIRGMETRYNEYCILAGVVRISPRPAEDFAGEKELDKEIKRLKDIYRRKDEMDYIATQINEVMIELGYQFVSSKVLRRKNGSEYDCSLYQADEEAGVSIYTDESGAVMMQMTMLGEGAATKEEEEISYQRQLDFCSAHPDIVEALARKGVLLKQVNYLPPSKEYTVKRQITQESGAKVVDRRRRRRGKQKVRSMQSS